MHTCPICNSDQVTACSIRYCVIYLECVNCDFEGIVKETPGDMADGILEHASFLENERGRHRGR